MTEMDERLCSDGGAGKLGQRMFSNFRCQSAIDYGNHYVHKAHCPRASNNTSNYCTHFPGPGLTLFGL